MLEKKSYQCNLFIKYILVLSISFLFTTCLYSIRNDSKPKGFNSCDSTSSIFIKNASFDLINLDIEKNNLNFRNKINPIIRDRLLCSKLFTDVELGRNREGYYLEFTGNSYSVAKPIYRLLLIFSHLSLTLLPGYDEQTHTLNLNVFRDGVFYKRYKSERIMDIYFWFPLVLAKNDSKKLNEIVDLLVADVVDQMKLDLLKEQKKSIE